MISKSEVLTVELHFIFEVRDLENIDVIADFVGWLFMRCD